jgi:hypothetical protein
MQVPCPRSRHPLSARIQSFSEPAPKFIAWVDGWARRLWRSAPSEGTWACVLLHQSRGATAHLEASKVNPQPPAGMVAAAEQDYRAVHDQLAVLVTTTRGPQQGGIDNSLRTAQQTTETRRYDCQSIKGTP